MDEGLTLYLKEINKVSDLTKAEELKLFNRILKDDEKAAEKLAEARMKRVAVIAQEYWEESNKKLDLLDVLHYGNTGLLRAAHSYTPGEYRFWKYAAWWVHKEIGNCRARLQKLRS